MTQILIFNTDLTRYPPIISIINILLKINSEIIYIGCCSDSVLKERLANLGVKFYDVIIDDTKANKCLKLVRLFMYRLRVRRILKKIDRSNHQLWIFGNQNMWVLNNWIGKFKTILYLFEFPELKVASSYRILSPIFNYKEAMQMADKVVCCEYNRAHLTKAYFQLKELPVVIPNKFSFDCFDISDDEPMIHDIKSKKIILYQGVLNYPERKLDELCESINYLPNDFVIVIMGLDSNYKYTLREKYESNRVIFLPFCTAPNHLNVTKYAYIGFLSYFSESGSVESCINLSYCAPNKVFEYSSFGVPMLANDLPALNGIFAHFKAGICVKDFTPSELAKAILSIEQNYDGYNVGAKLFFESVDIDALVCDLVQ